MASAPLRRVLLNRDDEPIHRHLRRSNPAQKTVAWMVPIDDEGPLVAARDQTLAPPWQPPSITQYSANRRTILAQFNLDERAGRITALGLSSDDQHLAVGTAQGAVLRYSLSRADVGGLS